MKQILLTALFSILVFTQSNASVSLPEPSIPREDKISAQVPILMTSFLEMKVKDVEKITGTRLSLKEKIAFLVLKSRIKKQTAANNEIERDNGKTSFILGLLGVVYLFIPYLAIASIPLAIIAIVEGKSALRKNPGNRKAKTGIILGWITIALIAAAIILIAALLSSFSFV